MRIVNATEFLSLVWPQTLLHNETLELRAIRRKDQVPLRKFCTSQSEVLAEASKLGEGWDIYYGISTRFQHGGKKSDCFRVSCLWVDFDNIAELPEFGHALQPDIIVNSGGGFHVYWLLSTSIVVRNNNYHEVEAVNRGLISRLNKNLKPAIPGKKYGGDAMTVDVTRILRIPDFFNFKYNPPKKVIAHEQAQS